MKPRVLLSCILLAFAFISAAVAEAVLYDRPNQQGEQYTLRNAHADLNDGGFRNRAQSMIVRDGSWQICSEVGFNGTCQTLKPGRYDTLGKFSGHIASIQPIGDQGPSASDGTPDGPVTSCHEDEVELCRSCEVTCQPPSVAVCTPGYSYVRPPGERWAECAHEPTCECIGG